MAKSRRRSFAPSPGQRALWPDVSGNGINGLGESCKRRPSPVYWHKPAIIAHGKVQDWSTARFRAEPTLGPIYKGDRGPVEPASKAERKVEDTPAGWTARLKSFALASEADLVGIARLDPAWVFEGFEVPKEPFIVIIGVEMDYERLKTAPRIPAAAEVMVQYNRGAKAARLLADWILGQGYEAAAQPGPMAGAMTLIPPALAAGLGELGKHGSIINRKYGSSFRLSGVRTELPLLADAPDRFGADEFCTACQACANACPPGAISDEKQMVRGEKRWYVDFDKCLPFFNETYGCAVCIAVCPWSRPGIAGNLVRKMARRRTL